MLRAHCPVSSPFLGLCGGATEENWEEVYYSTPWRHVDWLVWWNAEYCTVHTGHSQLHDEE